MSPPLTIFRRPSTHIIILYILSIIISLLLFYSCTFHCFHCPPSSSGTLFVAQYFPIVVSPFIAVISTGWLITKLFYSTDPCSLSYNFFEMPSAVFSSLAAGICAVIEILYSTDFNQMEWIDKISSSAAISIALCALHAIAAFSLE
ncbi:hypothetical protein PRIPAC_88518 [Pristionchus pacificus]|uniref:Uncharacterized protein n=1 Tax=Pristionchus pacificus TaxID=54126 RepID=A0A2A6BZA9_PRIPA|nr:hypothetical protein PRIPAC_88518 [Pristionchus pacificus]|eukprot:PDM71228.1 hypothetical protein PRIPAC_43611 [Pristionchus pacificus]